MSKRGYYLGGHGIWYGGVASSKNRIKRVGLLEIAAAEFSPTPSKLIKRNTKQAIKAQLGIRSAARNIQPVKKEGE
jgi:hypothetical protein